MFQKDSKYLENFLGIQSDSSTNFNCWPTGRSRYCLGCCQRQPPIPCQQPRTFGRISWRCHHLRCYPICQPNCLSSRYWNRCHQDPSKYSLSVLVACRLKIFGNIWDEMTMNFYCIFSTTLKMSSVKLHTDMLMPDKLMLPSVMLPEMFAEVMPTSTPPVLKSFFFYLCFLPFQFPDRLIIFFFSYA